MVSVAIPPLLRRLTIWYSTPLELRFSQTFHRQCHLSRLPVVNLCHPRTYMFHPSLSTRRFLPLFQLVLHFAAFLQFSSSSLWTASNLIVCTWIVNLHKSARHIPLVSSPDDSDSDTVVPRWNFRIFNCECIFCEYDILQPSTKSLMTSHGKHSRSTVLEFNQNLHHLSE